MTNQNETNNLREALAALCHEQWSGWMKCLLDKCDAVAPYLMSKPYAIQAQIIPFELVKRWSRQMTTPYIDLSEEEKDSDRKEADKIIKLVSEKRMGKLYAVINRQEKVIRKLSGKLGTTCCEMCGGEMDAEGANPPYMDCNTWKCVECGHVEPEVASGKFGGES